MIWLFGIFANWVFYKNSSCGFEQLQSFIGRFNLVSYHIKIWYKSYLNCKTDIVFRIYILDSNKDLISEKQITFFSFGDLRGILVISLEWFPTFPLSLANQIHKNFNHLSMFNPLTTAQPWSVERFARGSCLGKFLRIDDDDVRVIVMDYDDDLCGYLMITCGQRNTFY